MKNTGFRFLKLGATALGASLAVSGVAHATCADLQLTGSAADNTASLQAAIDRCSKSTDHLITLTGNPNPALINTVTLASNIVLKIGQGFVLKGTTNILATSAVLVGKDIDRVTITGTGTIDGNGFSYWQPAIGNEDTPRPKLIKIKGSNIWVGSNFTDAGGGATQSLVKFPSGQNDISQTLKIRNSPKEQLVFEAGSQNVHVDGVWIYADPTRNDLGKNKAPNTDAIDIVGTTTATITNCLLDTGDDNIAIKSNLNGPATSGVRISACVIGGGHGISIGGQEAAGHTVASPGVSDVTVSNIHFKGTDFGYRIKTDQSATNSGATTGVRYSNTCMQNVGTAFLFTYLYTTATGGTPPIIDNVTIDNVRGSATKSQGNIIGLSNHLMGPIKITNTELAGGKAFNVQSGTLQLGGNSLKTNPPTTTANSNGTITPVSDSGATVACPGSIVIPPQV